MKRIIFNCCLILFFGATFSGFAQDHLRIRVDNLNFEKISGNAIDNLNLLNTKQQTVNYTFQAQLGYWKRLDRQKNNYLIIRGGVRQRAIDRSVNLSQILGSISQTGTDRVNQLSFLGGVGLGKAFVFEKIMVSLSADVTYQRFTAIEFDSEVEAIDTVSNTSTSISVSERQPALNAFHLNTDIQIGYVFWERLLLSAGINSGLLLSLQSGEVTASYRIDNGGIVSNPTITDDITLRDFQRKNPTAFFSVGFYF